ncbi:MAG TPA: hypothetical protein VFK30_14460 [Anaerolineae bacterium]|nr:hypothetical protein [Anaerolineae bacterium]
MHTYRPGESVRGTLQLIAKSDLHPRSIMLHAFGDEITSLGPNIAMKAHTHPFDLAFQLWAPSIEQNALSKGEHAFPFDFSLPTILPPTFNGDLTKIAYRIEVKVDLPLVPDLHVEQAFTVLVAPITGAEKPVRATASLPGGLTLELQLKAVAYSPGDHITGNVQIIGTMESIKAASVDLLWREKGEAHDFVDHSEGTNVRLEIDPKVLLSGQPFSIDIPVPLDADPSFVSQHASMTRLVRAEVKLAGDKSLLAETMIRIGAK